MSQTHKERCIDNDKETIITVLTTQKDIMKNIFLCIVFNVRDMHVNALMGKKLAITETCSDLNSLSKSSILD